MVLLLCGIAAALAGCYPRAQSAVYVGKDCQLVDRNGTVLTKLFIEPGRSVVWINPTSHDVVLVFSNHKVLGGAESVRLGPGERRTVRVGSYEGKKFSWRLVCRPENWPGQGGTPPDDDKSDDEKETDGDGGPPTPKDPPPCPEPPEPCPPEGG
jgi:hypothetical protein